LQIKALFDGLEQYIYFTYDSLLSSGYSIKESKKMVLDHMNKYIKAFSEIPEEQQKEVDEQALFDKRNKNKL